MLYYDLNTDNRRRTIQPAVETRTVLPEAGAGQLALTFPGLMPTSPLPAANVAMVPQRSPLRYPGGKTWLVPHIRHWLGKIQPAPELLIEPFAGGGIVSLTAVMEGLVDRCLMIELDPDVAAFWQACLRYGPQLCDKVRNFRPTRETVLELSHKNGSGVVEHGFRTLVMNRTRRGGILASGASLSRSGENGKGVASRWYPETLIRRLCDITRHADRIDFAEADSMALLDTLLQGRRDKVAVFIDPPYTAGGKRAGKRLYTHNRIDHSQLFAVLSDTDANFLMTYDHAPEIETLVRRHGFHAVQVMMQNTHHARVPELVISPQPVFTQ